MADANDTSELPGSLSKGQRMLEMAKHVIGKALKWGVIGAVVGGVLVAIPGVGIGSLLSAVTGGAIGSGVAGAGISAAISTGLTIGGLAAAAGGLMGLTSASQAAEEAQEESIFNYNRRQMNAQQQVMMQQSYRQQQAAMAQQGHDLGVSAPAAGLGRGQGQMPGMG